jgi:CBS domain-containing protein
MVRVEILMSRPVVAVAQGMEAAEALDLALQHRVHHLPVVDGDVAVGLVCTCDLEESHPTGPVGLVMKRPALSVVPSTLGSEALDIMNAHRVGSLIVVDADKVVGIVTRRDLERAAVPVMSDPRGHCSCCGSLSHLREHVTGALCVECLARSRLSHEEGEIGGGD